MATKYEMKDLNDKEDLWLRAVRFRSLVLENHEISLKNKSLLMIIDAYHGTITVERIKEICSDGKTSIIAGLKELEEIGYIEKHRERNEQGKWDATSYEITIYNNMDEENSSLAEDKF